MALEYTLKHLEKDLKSGAVKAEYCDALRCYIRITDRQGNEVVIADPDSAIPKMGEFFLKAIKESKSATDRREYAAMLIKLVHYRLNQTGGLGSQRKPAKRLISA